MVFQINSASFPPGGTIPSRLTCDGGSISPHLAWTDPPAETKSLALIIDDPDAPDPAAPRMVWVHWVLYNLPPTFTSLSEGVAIRDLPAGTRHGVNGWHRTGYEGPCPPVGRHRYVHRLFALNTLMPDLQQPTKKVLERFMQGHVLAKTQLIGYYQRPD